MSALIEFDAVCKYYQMGDTTVKAADHITMKIEKGEFVAIVGQSGSGKSTCMNIIGCLDVPTAGTYRLNGRDVGKMSRNELASIRNEMLGFIFQQYNLLPKLNLLENVEVPLVYAGISRAERHIRAREVLAAGKLVGAVFQLVAKPHLLQHGAGAAVALGAGDARIHQRHLHVFQQVQPGQQVVLLEDKAQHLVADRSQLVAVHLAHIPAVEPVGSVGGHIQTADDVHTGRLAGTGLADDGHELAFFDFHGDVVCCFYRGITHLVILAHLIKLDQSAHRFLLR